MVFFCFELARGTQKIFEIATYPLLVGERAPYGKQIVSELATQLQTQFGKRRFQERNIRRMMLFAELSPDSDFLSELATELSWSDFIELLGVKKPLERTF